MSKFAMDVITAHARSTGFVYQGSEIYDGLANTWDYGPLGVLLKNNLQDAWWRKFIRESPYNVGLDAAILMNPKVWEATGHVGGFSDPLMDCRDCKTRHRADKLIEAYDPSLHCDGWSNEQLTSFIKEHHIKCPNCGSENFTDIRQFQLMFKTSMGVVEDEKSTVYLRPETAQGIFVNFRNVQRTTRKKIPFGIGQIGKAFRNEITPGSFIFRTREFEQMELEFFCKPETDLEWFAYWKQFCMDFLIRLGLNSEHLRFRDHEQAELAFYSRATSDIEYAYPFGWGELWGIADRTDYDLKRHMEYSKKPLDYLDPATNERYIPYTIEPSVGVGRMFLAVLCDSYDEEMVNDKDQRVVMHLHPALAPYQTAVLPLTKKQAPQARALYERLLSQFSLDYDEAGNIGKRYRRQDAIGTPYCVTVDFDTADDDCVTVRDRDSMAQERVKIAALAAYLQDHCQL